MKIARFDIAAHLHYGDMKKVAVKYGIGKSHLTEMMYGRRNANVEAIKELEQTAAINVWKERFCKNESLL